eukprot:ctg_597.g291
MTRMRAIRGDAVRAESARAARIAIEGSDVAGSRSVRPAAGNGGRWSLRDTDDRTVRRPRHRVMFVTAAVSRDNGTGRRQWKPVARSGRSLPRGAALAGRSATHRSASGDALRAGSVGWRPRLRARNGYMSAAPVGDGSPADGVVATTSSTTTAAADVEVEPLSAEAVSRAAPPLPVPAGGQSAAVYAGKTHCGVEERQLQRAVLPGTLSRLQDHARRTAARGTGAMRWFAAAATAHQRRQGHILLCQRGGIAVAKAGAPRRHPGHGVRRALHTPALRRRQVPRPRFRRRPTGHRGRHDVRVRQGQQRARQKSA